MAKAGISQRELARRVGVTSPTVNAAVRAGLIDRCADGGVDPDGPGTLAYIAARKAGTVSNAVIGVSAKVAAFQAKARLLRQRLDEQEATLVERDVYLQRNLEHVPLIRAWLTGIRERRAEQLAMALGCSVETARAVLDELILRITAELGDVAAEVTAAILAA